MQLAIGQGKKQYKFAQTPFAKGGEGCVFDVLGQPALVAKIYHPKGRVKEREQKLLAMLKNRPSVDTDAQVAWPCDILYDPVSGAFLGFVMPRIKNVMKIDNLYSFDNRDRHSWSWYVKVAKNLCAAVYSVHKSGHVIGDLNPANICVDPSTALVTLVDTDSYSIKGQGREFRCTVCRPEYVPSEVHRMLDYGTDLKSAPFSVFTSYTDCFALGVHIFALLMNGCHPFACTVSDDRTGERYNLLSNIKSGFFPFSSRAVGVGVPKYAPPLESLPFGLRNLLVRTFSAGSSEQTLRVSPQEWFNELSRLEKSLAQCGKKSTHQYWNGLSSCPLCAQEGKMKNLLSRGRQGTKQAPYMTPRTPASPGGAVTGGGTAGGGSSAIASARAAVAASIAASKPNPASSTATSSTTSGNTTSSSTTSSNTTSGTSGGAISGGGYHPFLWALGSIFKHLFALVFWVGINLLAHWLLLKVPLSTWWWGLIRYATLGIIPFIPLWIFALIDEIFWFDFTEDITDIYIRFTRGVTYVAYVGVAVYAGIQSGSWINTAFWTVLIVLPVNLTCRLLPGITWDM